MGPPDIGKRVLGRLVARRLRAAFIPFPQLGFSSPTAKLLLVLMGTNPNYLEENPGWWSHIYAAHLMESAERIRAELQVRPVVVTNYVFSFRKWFLGASLNEQKLFEGFFPSMPIPVQAFNIVNAPSWSGPGNFKIAWSNVLKLRLQMSFSQSKLGLIHTIEYPQTDFRHVAINRMAEDITIPLARRYSLKINPMEYVALGDIPLKKDE